MPARTPSHERQPSPKSPEAAKLAALRKLLKEGEESGEPIDYTPQDLLDDINGNYPNA